ncbi:MAG: hypothetical protein ABEK50_12650 [bacterium]
MSTRQLVGVLLILLTVTGYPEPGRSHSGGLVNLNPCRRSTSSGTDKLTVHFDVFQSGNGPFCHRLPAPGDAQIVLKINEKRQSGRTNVTIRKKDSPGTSPVHRAGSEAFSGGIFSELVRFPEPDIYEVIITQPQINQKLIFTLYVGVSPPPGLRLKNSLLNILESPYLLVSLLLLGLGATIYYFD